MKAYHIDRLVLTHLSYGGEPFHDTHGNRVGFIEYAVNTPQEKQTLQADMSGTTTEQSIDCGYLVVYDDDTPTFHAPRINHQGQNLDLSRIDLGVLHVSLNSEGLPWDVLHSATVDLCYGDWETRVALQSSNAPLVLSKAFGHAMTANMRYRLTQYCMSGAPIHGGWIHVALAHGQAEITLIP
ncbi:MAG: hypothetical protein ABW202_03220 [Duganella sp.]